MKKRVIVVQQHEFIISQSTATMLQMAANDVGRKDIAKEAGVSVRTVEAHFDSVRKALGKKTFAAALVELLRKNIIK